MTQDHECPRCHEPYDRFETVLDCMANHERVAVLRDHNDPVLSADQITDAELGAYAASRMRDEWLRQPTACANAHLITWTPSVTGDGPPPGAYYCERCGDAVIVPERPEGTVPLTFAHEGPEDDREWWRN